MGRSPAGDVCLAGGGAATISAVPRWLPNALTVLRIALVPAFIVHARWCAEDAAAGREDAPHRWLALGAFLVIGLSDVADGHLARRFGLATQLGATLDAVADKLAQLSALVFFLVADGVAYARTPAWLIGVLVGRDLLLGVGYLMIRARRGRVLVVHEHHGRLASLLLFLLVLWIAADLPRAAVVPSCALIVLIVLASTAGYARDGWRQWARPAA